MSKIFDGSDEPLTYGQALILIASATPWRDELHGREVIAALQVEFDMVPDEPDELVDLADPRDLTLRKQDEELKRLRNELDRRKHRDDVIASNANEAERLRLELDDARGRTGLADVREHTATGLPGETDVELERIRRARAGEVAATESERIRAGATGSTVPRFGEVGRDAELERVRVRDDAADDWRGTSGEAGRDAELERVRARDDVADGQAGAVDPRDAELLARSTPAPGRGPIEPPTTPAPTPAPARRPGRGR